MRKTRLVILPTKCLHQMGFLLLFLSCPVIGDWGRIRPDSAMSHKAIQIEREGTCGLQRDPPGGLLDLSTNGFKKSRTGESCDTIKQIEANTERIERTDVIRVEMRKVNDNQRRNERATVRRVAEERKDVRREQGEELRRVQRDVRREKQNVRREQRDMRREQQEVRRERGIEKAARRNFRSARERSATRRIDSRRISVDRSRPLERKTQTKSEANVRSVSLNRMKNEEGAVRRQRSIERNEIRISVTRQEVVNERNAKTSKRRLSLAKQMNERHGERKTEQQRRMYRKIRNERRENDRTMASAGKRENASLVRAVSSEKRENERTAVRTSVSAEIRKIQRKNNERAVRRLSVRSVERQENPKAIRASTPVEMRENERLLRRTSQKQREHESTTRRVISVEIRETQRENIERSIPRLSPSRRENKRTEQNNTPLNERKLRQEQNNNQIRDTRAEKSEEVQHVQHRPIEDVGRRSNKIRGIQKTRSLEARRNPIEGEKVNMARKSNNRRDMKNERVASFSSKFRGICDERRISPSGMRLERLDVVKVARLSPKQQMSAEESKTEQEESFGGIIKWTGLKNHDSKVGEWATNCVIGAVAYYLTSRQVKTV